MKLNDKLEMGLKFIKRYAWIVLVPVLLDLMRLVAYRYIYHTGYTPEITGLFKIKLSLISAPPSLSFLLEDFPGILLHYVNDSFTGIIYELTYFNVFMLMTAMLMTSFIKAGYLGVLSEAVEEERRIKDFFIIGNRLWLKFFILEAIIMTPLFLILLNKSLIYLLLINIVLVYVPYAFALEEERIFDSFANGIGFLFSNLGLTIKMTLYYGLIISLSGFLIYLISSNLYGQIISIIVIGALGGAVNKAVLEIYREKGLKEKEA